MIFHNITCYTNSLLSHIYVNTTNPLTCVEVWFPPIGCCVSLSWDHQGWAEKYATLMLLQFLIFFNLGPKVDNFSFLCPLWILL